MSVEPAPIPTAIPIPRVRRFAELEPGEFADSFALVGELSNAVTGKGDPYIKLVLRDRVRSAPAFIWRDRDCFDFVAGQLRVGDICKIRGRYGVDEKYGPRLEIDKIRRYDPAIDKDFQPEELFRASRFEIPNMWIELNALVAEHIRDEGVRIVTAEVLRRNEPAFKTAPAASMNHHAYVGGLLEHTLSVARLAVHLADKYVEQYRGTGVGLDKDLVVAGAVLHDIGKVVELDTRPGISEYTTVGRLVGHIQIGRDMLREAAEAVPQLDPVKRMVLEHIILSHQGKKEWSSPVEPRTLEALLVHFADDMDAKTNMFVEALTGESGSGGFTGRRNMFGRELWRGPA